MLGGDLPLEFANNEKNIINSPHGFQNFTTNGAAFYLPYSIWSSEEPGEIDSQEEKTKERWNDVPVLTQTCHIRAAIQTQGLIPRSVHYSIP